METIELEIKDRYYLDFAFTEAGSILYGSHYRLTGDNQTIKDLRDSLMTLREAKIISDKEEISKAEYNRDFNQYMTWKTLEAVKQSGRFDKFIEEEKKIS